MGNIIEKTVLETIRGLSEDDQEIVLYLADIFRGEEDALCEYCRNEFSA